MKFFYDEFLVNVNKIYLEWKIMEWKYTEIEVKDSLREAEKHEIKLFKTQIKRLKNIKDKHFSLNKDLKMFKDGSSKLHMILKHEIWQKNV